MANCERAVCLQPRYTVEKVHIRVREDDTIQRGLVSVGLKKKLIVGCDVCMRTS